MQFAIEERFYGLSWAYTPGAAAPSAQRSRAIRFSWQHCWAVMRRRSVWCSQGASSSSRPSAQAWNCSPEG
ncbi:MAG: hypothetical protein IJ066_12030 [Bacteroidaceae bacterium]|nr:hypothetical protein [Bacteroidaceae bacterium]